MIKGEAIIKNKGTFVGTGWQGATIQVKYPMSLSDGTRQTSNLNPITSGDFIVDNTGFVWKITECVKNETDYTCTLVEQSTYTPTNDLTPDTILEKGLVVTPNIKNLLSPYYHDSYVAINAFRAAMSYNMKKYNKSADPNQQGYTLQLSSSSKLFGSGYHLFILDKNNYTWVVGSYTNIYNLYSLDMSNFVTIKDPDSSKYFGFKNIYRGYDSSSIPDMAVDTNDSRGYSFGNNNYYGRMGIGTASYTSPSVIYEIIGGTQFSKFMNGSKVSIALDINNKVWVLGNGTDLGMGLGNTMYTSFIPFDSSNTYIDIVSGYDFSGGLRTNGTLRLWGDNSRGQLGIGTTISSSTPVTVNGNHVFTKVYCYGKTIYGIDNNDDLWMWGDDAHCILEGIGITTGYTTVPQKVSTTKFSKVCPSSTHCLGLGLNGQVYGWGRTNNGRVGNGTSTTNGKITMPTQCIGTPICIDIATTMNTSYAIDYLYNLWGWGMNQNSFGSEFPTNDLVAPTLIHSN